MEYNTTRNQLIIAEYGRNVQKMIEYACTIEDRVERNKCANSIIRVMGQINPHLRDVIDFRHKLYDHLLIISDFKLDIDSPFPMPSRESLKVKPAPIPYSTNNIRFKHYGKTLQILIKQACDYSDGLEKTMLTYLLAMQMKKSYVNWNSEYPSDEVIAEQLKILSGGKLEYTQEMQSIASQLAINKPGFGEYRRLDNKGSNKNKKNNNYHKNGGLNKQQSKSK